MLKLFHSPFAQRAFLFFGMLLLASNLMLGQERRAPVLKGGVTKQVGSVEDACQVLRDAADLNRAAAKSPENTESTKWKDTGEKLNALFAYEPESEFHRDLTMNCHCPIMTTRMRIERLRHLQIMRMNSPARDARSLKNRDLAIKQETDHIPIEIKRTEECYKKVCKVSPAKERPGRDNTSGPVRGASGNSPSRPINKAPTDQQWQKVEVGKLLDAEGDNLRNLRAGRVVATGRSTPDFNCYGYAANAEDPPGWVGPWPYAGGPLPRRRIPISNTTVLLRDFFDKYGWGPSRQYDPATDSKLPPAGTERIVIYARQGSDGKWQAEHAALVKHDGIYAKMGNLGTFRFDSLDQMSGGTFGTPRWVLER